MEFKKQLDGSHPKAVLEITNQIEDQNLAYKIKTTAPKLFVVKPIQGVVMPGRTVYVEINLQMGSITSFADIYKNKFMI